VEEVIEVVDTSGIDKETHFMSIPIGDLERRKAAARIRFLAMNLYEPPIGSMWGLYNDRKINMT
jgi:hypothetical protein